MSFDKVTSNEDLIVGLNRYQYLYLFYGIYTKTCFSRVANFVMEGIEEQRVCVKFGFKLGKSSSETFKPL